MKKVREKLAEIGFDAFLVSDEKNIYYLSGFPWGLKLLIPVEGENILFVNSVNYEAAKSLAKNVLIELVGIGEKIEKKISDVVLRGRFKSIGLDKMDVSEYWRIKNSLEEVRFEVLGDVIWSLRKVKDESELVLIKRAAELTSRGMERALEVIKPGIKEWVVAAEAEYEMRKLGSSGVAFDTIVCSGPETAYPHGGLGEREIKDGDFVVIDIGAKYRGYCADMTRTVIVGEGARMQKHIYEIVVGAQRIALNHIRAGIKAKEIDEAARKFIVENGYGEYFIHNLGHGVGLDIHEPPMLGPLSEDLLLAGNVVTVEPGIYIPGLGGARIEDTILVEKGGAIKLTGINGE
ncbi:MAG: Xaa-Pro peptidase family protein [Candidatus Bathyarchaeia archaeon]|nr:aminopeptidase P family protein [Candidatus Bathyarchaeota archaeon]